MPNSGKSLQEIPEDYFHAHEEGGEGWHHKKQVKDNKPPPKSFQHTSAREEGWQTNFAVMTPTGLKKTFSMPIRKVDNKHFKFRSMASNCPKRLTLCSSARGEVRHPKFGTITPNDLKE